MAEGGREQTGKRPGNRVFPIEIAGEKCAASRIIRKYFFFKNGRGVVFHHYIVEFDLTQEFLCQTLGVRRASVSEVASALQRAYSFATRVEKSPSSIGAGISEVASKLQKAGMIRYSRETIEIVDRARLEAASCECYEAIQNEFNRLLGAPQKQGPK